MISLQPKFMSIGVVDVSFARTHVNFGPAPDLVLMQFRAVGGSAAGSRFNGAVLPAGSESCEFRADGIVTYQVSHTLQMTGECALLMTYSGMSDVGEDGYERALDDRMPETVRVDAAARFFTSAPNYRWLNRLYCIVQGERDFLRGSLHCDIFAPIGADT